MKVFLFGFMGSGKTTYGVKIAQALNYNFIDLDDYLEKKAGRTIKHIFETEGEKKFRELERSVLLEVIKQDNIVVSTGGGTPCFFDNIEVMKKNGVTVYLEADINTLSDRLFNAKIHRPLIWGKSKQELVEYIENSVEQRNKFYKQASIIVDAKNLDIKKLI